jgi:hypothetical protein
MNRPPEPPPEGVLIEHARNEARLSVREAARRAGISEGWWRQVVKGYQPMGDGGYVLRHAPADTVANMARVVQVSPDQLQAEGQRPDAAEVMRETATETLRPDIEPAFPEVTPAMLDAQERHLEEVRLRVELASRRHPGRRLTGRQVFPTSPRDAKSWDDLTSAGWAPETIERGIATLQAWESEEARLGEDGYATG